MTAPLPREFFARPSPELAPDLLGCVLEHETAEGVVAVRLTETEAYAGTADPASHAYRGETRRTTVMYGPPGHAYVYFTYGLHFCVNIVCQPAGLASAVLIRAGEIVRGEPLARQRRTRSPRPGANSGVGRAQQPAIPARDLARGPARLCVALAIDQAQNGADLCAETSALRLLPQESNVSQQQSPSINAGPRVGVSAAAEINWRYWLADDPTVSPYRAHVKRAR